MRTTRNVDGAESVERIVKAALAELPPTGPILLGAGAATERLAEVLPSDRPLTVITNAVAIGQTLAPRPNTTVALIGGRLDPRTGAVVDAWALDELAQVCAEIAFVVPDGVSVRRGLTATSLAGRGGARRDDPGGAAHGPAGRPLPDRGGPHGAVRRHRRRRCHDH